jgi:hypothetical protein
VLLEKDDKWQLQHRYEQVESVANLPNPMSDDRLLSRPEASVMK